MKPKPQATENDPGQALATFERLPEETKDLMKLKHQNEKSTGPEQVEIAKQIQEKARKPRP
ncbi:MAG: hypothetical protein IH623_06805 [Verrucomicrobia bacterium]|nr:hypothetical protein [Verrucomicrobiota bacterium]